MWRREEEVFFFLGIGFVFFLVLLILKVRFGCGFCIRWRAVFFGRFELFILGRFRVRGFYSGLGV